MIQITDKTKCCGCSSCANACPKSAIIMMPDEEGFSYPVIDKTLCINCGICNHVCPIENQPVNQNPVREAYVIRTIDRNILKDSTSGGFITPLAEYVLNHRGLLCAASYDKDFNVRHIIIGENEKYRLSDIRGSKYVQSSIDDCYEKIKKYLEQNRMVCFVGTTCQVAGLMSFLNKNYDNLITVDLVCHGTPSPKLWNKYLKYQKERYHSEIDRISFRNKTYGYHSGTMKIRFLNGKTYYGSARVDYMLRSFFKEIASRPICYQCPFKSVDRASDFTIYDCWHASELVTSLKDDDMGYTNLIVQSEKGKQLLNKISRKYEIYQVDIEKAIRLDGIMILNSAKPHRRRSEFYLDIDKRTMKEQVQKFIPVKTKDYFVERMKIVLYSLGIYHVVKKIMQK